MFDTTIRRLYAPMLARTARGLHRRRVSADMITVVGLVLGLGAATAAATSSWWIALVLWLASRVVDGIDGLVARLRGPSPRGGFVDLVADFAVYAAFVAGVAIAQPDARLAAVVLLCTYYVSAAAFLTWASLSGEMRRDVGLEISDDRSVRFVGGLAEGFETVVAYAAVCVTPTHAELILWVFAGMVGVTAVQRVAFAISHLDAAAPD